VREQLQREQEELQQWQRQLTEREQKQPQSALEPEAPTLPASPGEQRVCPYGHARSAGDTTFESCVEVFAKTKEYRDRTWQAGRLVANHGMVRGRHYKLTYQEDYPDQWPPRWVGGSWIGEFVGETDTHYELNAGTYAGGGSLPKHWVYEIIEVPVGHAMFISRLQGPRR
jgi:hypothetical protein